MDTIFRKSFDRYLSLLDYFSDFYAVVLCKLSFYNSPKGDYTLYNFQWMVVLIYV